MDSDEHPANRSTIAALKADIRRQALAARDAVPVGVRIAAAFLIAEHAESLVPADTDIVAGYLPIRSEVDPRPLMARLRDRGRRLCLPAPLPGGGLEFRELLPDTALARDRFGTLSPVPGTGVLRPDVVLVPLAAFDARGHRIGYGGGFYDRALAALRATQAPCLSIGLALAVQAVPKVPDERFDMALDSVVTERGVVSRG